MNGLKYGKVRNKELEEHWALDNNRKYVINFPRNSNNCGKIPPKVGTGQIVQLFSNSFAQIKYSEIKFYDNICGGASFGRPRIVLYFCLSGEFALEENELTVDTSNFLTFIASDLKRVRFQPDIYHRIITIEIYPDKISDFGGDSSYRAMLHSFKLKNMDFATYGLSTTMKTLLHQLLNCPYKESVKTIYMEGKFLEFLAVYLNESLYQNEAIVDHCPNLSRQDIKSIYQAKQKLDQEFISPPTLAALSKMVCLNEFKLKSGFKQVFGQTVHAYTVDKRLELARQLFEEKKLNVGEVASHIGYSNASYFALTFRRKFGISPSEYLERNK